MYVYHEEFGWGKVIRHDIEKAAMTVDFTDVPYGEEIEKEVALSDVKNAYERFRELALEYDKNPDAFELVPTVVYRDRMNDGDYIAYDEVVFVPKEIAGEVSYMIATTACSRTPYRLVILTSVDRGVRAVGIEEKQPQ